MVNKIILIGNLGADPEQPQTSGQPLTTMRVATSRTWKDDSGNQQSQTEWHRVKVWGRQAENCARYLSKGSKVYIEGRISYGSYEKDGHTFYTTDIIAQTVQFLDSRREEDQGGWQDRKKKGGPRHEHKGQGYGNYNPPPPDDDSIPF